MTRKRLTAEQIIMKPREAEVGLEQQSTARMDNRRDIIRRIVNNVVVSIVLARPTLPLRVT